MGDPLRLLFLLPFAPRLDAAHGGGRVMAQLLVRLAERHRVALLYLRAADEPPLDTRLQERCDVVEEITRPPIRRSWSRRMRLTLALLRGSPMWASDWAVAAYARRLRVLAAAWQPDIVQVEFHIMGQYLSALDGCPAPRVLVQHEPGAEAARQRQLPGQGTRVLQYLDLLAWQRFERRITQQVQTVVVFTERDRQDLARAGGQTPIVRIPLGAAVPERPLHPLGCRPWNLLFVGNFAHPPNEEAALRLARTIFPRAQAQLPELTLYIVGEQPPLELRQLASARVVVTGHVPDVAPYLDRASLVVVPLRSGGGMRVKVLEALAAGKPVLASPLAVEGLDVRDGEQVAVARSDQEFADGIVRLLSDPERRCQLAAQGRAWARANLDWAKPVDRYEKVYERLLRSSHTREVAR